MDKTFKDKVMTIQSNLKAPKSQVNKFGGYHYRSCEDILEAVKPLLAQSGLVLLITDEMVNIGERVYVKATATLTDGPETFSASAFAREPLSKKGQDESQITGASSSYARKYALGGLLCIDDTADPDVTNTHGSNDGVNEAVDYLNKCNTPEEVEYAWNYYQPYYGENETFKVAYMKKKKALTNGIAK